MACKYTLDGQVLSELEFKQEVARRFANKPIDLNGVVKEFSKAKAIETPQAGSVVGEGSEEKTFAGKGVSVKDAPKGNHLNIGMKIGRGDEMLTQKEILAKLPKDVKVESVSVVEGTEPTLSIKTSRKLTDAEMAKLMDDTQQQAIPQLTDGVGVLHDAKAGTSEAWGDFNPDYFVAQDGKKLSEVKAETPKAETEADNKLLKEKNLKPNKIIRGINSAIHNIAKKIRGGKAAAKMILSVSENDGKRIADAYDEMKHDPDNPEVIKAFTELVVEIKKQADALIKEGYKFELAKEGEGYESNSQKMLEDVKGNKRILIDPSSKAFGTERTFDKDNIGLQDSGYKDVNGVPLTNVELVRGVHDLFGHSEYGNGFGAIGEENAWRIHMSMFSPLAQKALTTTTRGQNSWVNFGKHLRNEDGSIKKVSAKDKPFAEQKMGFLPDWAMDNAYGDVVKVNGKDVKPVNKFVIDGKEVYSIDDAKSFREAIVAARDNMKENGKNDWIQVHVKTEKEYQDIVKKGGQLLISKDGKVGVIVEADGNVGSGFSHVDTPKGSLAPLLNMAIKLGGRYTDAYDTYLPKYYAKFGFKVSGRMKFDAAEAEAGWENTSLKDKPDVVFMYWDGGNREAIDKNFDKFEPYNKSDGEYFTDYDKAVQSAKEKSNEIEPESSLLPVEPAEAPLKEEVKAKKETEKEVKKESKISFEKRPTTMPDGEEGVELVVKYADGKEKSAGKFYPEDTKEMAKAERGHRLQEAKSELSSALKDLLDAGDITKLGFAAGNVGEKSAEALYKVHKALVKYAKVYISQGVTDVKQFAKKVGVSVKNAQQAWDEATGAKTYAKGGLDYDLADISKTAIRRGINVREKLAEYKQKSKDIGKAVSDFIDDAEIKGALTATELKALVKKAANISTDKQFEKFTNYAEKVIGDANYAQEISDVKAQSKAARKGKHGRFTQMVKQFASIDPEVLTDANLEKYKEAIDGLNERIPSYDKMAEHYNEIMVDVDAQGDNYSNVKTFNDASKKFADISSQSVKAVDDYRNLARNITGLKNRLKNLLADGDITQQEYTDIIDEIESKTSAVGGRLSAEIETLKAQQVKDIKSTPLDRSQLTPQENALLERFNSLGAEDLKKLSVGELDLLQEAVSRVEQGFVPMQKVTDIVNRAEALKFAPKIVEELNAATKGDVAKAGLTRDMKINEAAFVSRILGVKEGGAVDRYIINPIVRQLSQSKKEISNAQKSFLDAKKGAFGLLTMPSTVKKSMNKLGLVFNMLQSKNGDAPADWVIMSGNEKEINKYVSQFEESKQAKVRASIKRQQNILEGNKKKQQIVKAAYDELLAKYDDGNGVIDLDKMKADIESGKGLSKAEQKLFDATNEIDNGLKNKQQAVNEMKGKEFAPIDYHLKRIELGRETELEKKEQGVRAKIEAGSAKSRTQKMPRAIETDLEKIVLGSIEETNTDYHATNATKYANEVIDEAALQGNFSNNALNAIRDNMQARINTEFVKSQTGGVLQKVLAARMAGSLVDVGRAVVETATAFTYTPLRAGNLKGYATFFNPAKRGLAHQLIMDTNSSLGLKHLNKNLEAGTEVNSKNLLVKIGEKVMTFPEHATLDMAWMPSFESAFEEITGEAFDGNKYKTDKLYREEHNQAILDAATEADVTAKQIVGGGLKFEGRQFIRILPEFAEKIGLPSSVDANSYPGKVAGFFGTYTARESKEFMDGFVKVYKGAKNKDIGTMGRGSGKVLGAALGAVGYGVGMGLYNSLWTKLTSDNEEYKKKAQGVIDSYYTWKGWTQETTAQLAFLGTSRYGAMGRFVTLLGVSAAYNKTDDPKEKEQIKEFAQNQLFTRPLEAEGKYGEKDRDAAIMQKYVPYLSFPVEQLYKEGKSFFDLADVVKEKGFESLGKDDKDKFVAGELLFNSINMMLMFKGTQVPMTKKIEQFIAEHKKEQESSGGKPKMAKPVKAKPYQ